MALVSFKRGLLKNLPATAADGVLYITTDEGGIYLGNGTEMKRLGDYVSVASIANLPTDHSKISKHALYYAEAENVLARSNGSKWIQINAAGLSEIDITGSGNAVTGATIEVNAITGARKLVLTKDEEFATSDDLDDAVDRIAAVERDIAALGGSGSGSIQSQIDAIVGGATADYNTLKKLEDKVKAAQKAADDAQADADTNASDISDLNTAVTNLGNTVSQNKQACEQAMTDLVAGETEYTTLKKIGDKFRAHDTQYNTLEGRVSEAETAIGENAEAITKNAQDIAKLDKDVTDRITTAIAEIVNADGDQDHFDTLKDIATWLQDHETDAIGMQNAISTNADDIDDLQGAMSQAQQDIFANYNTLNNKIDTTKSDLVNGATNKGDTLKKLEDRLATAESTLNTHGNDISNLQTDLSELSGDVGELAQTVSSNNSAVNKKIDDAVADLQGKIDTANSNIQINANNIATNADDIADLTAVVATHTAALTWGSFN